MLAFGFLVTLFLAAPRNALAWGPSAHEQIEDAAAKLMAGQNHPLALLLSPNIQTLKRIGLVPDADWRPSSAAKVADARTKKVAAKASAVAVSYREQGLHYFEADAFLRFGTAENAVLTLPMGEYRVSYPKYRALLADNVAFVLEFERNQSDPAAYGTAPWRVLQLYDLAVTAIRAREAAKTLYYLGLLGHYVGDLAEPLNTTLNFDGQHYPISAKGVYAAFEQGVFEEQPSPAGTVAHEAQDALAGRGLDGITRDRVVPELFKLVNDGAELIDPLLKAFSLQCGQAHGRGLASAEHDRAGAHPGSAGSCEPPVETDATRVVVRGFLNTTLGKGEDAETVRGLADRRLGEAAALTARLWSAAYNEAGRPVLPSQSVSFDSLKAAETYVSPDYLPARSAGGGR